MTLKFETESTDAICWPKTLNVFQKLICQGWLANPDIGRMKLTLLPEDNEMSYVLCPFTASSEYEHAAQRWWNCVVQRYALRSRSHLTAHQNWRLLLLIFLHQSRFL